MVPEGGGTLDTAGGRTLGDTRAGQTVHGDSQSLTDGGSFSTLRAEQAVGTDFLCAEGVVTLNTAGGNALDAKRAE